MLGMLLTIVCRMSVKIDKKGKKDQEESSSSSDSDGGGGMTLGIGFGGNAKGKAPAVPDYKPISLSCKVCHKNFGAILKAVSVSFSPFFLFYICTILIVMVGTLRALLRRSLFVMHISTSLQAIGLGNSQSSL